MYFYANTTLPYSKLSNIWSNYFAIVCVRWNKSPHLVCIRLNLFLLSSVSNIFSLFVLSRNCMRLFWVLSLLLNWLCSWELLVSREFNCRDFIFAKELNSLDFMFTKDFAIFSFMFANNFTFVNLVLPSSEAEVVISSEK